MRTSVSLDVMRVKVTPTKLDINPVLVAGGTIENIFNLSRTGMVRISFVSFDFEPTSVTRDGREIFHYEILSFDTNKQEVYLVS